MSPRLARYSESSLKAKALTPNACSVRELDGLSVADSLASEKISILGL